MTVADLIAELQKMPPHKECRVCTRSIAMADESGDWEQHLTEEDAMAVNEVRNEGAFILVWGDQQ